MLLVTCDHAAHFTAENTLRKCKGELGFRPGARCFSHVTKCYPVLLKSKKLPFLSSRDSQPSPGLYQAPANRPIRSARVIRTHDPPHLIHCCDQCMSHVRQTRSPWLRQLTNHNPWASLRFHLVKSPMHASFCPNVINLLSLCHEHDFRGLGSFCRFPEFDQLAVVVCLRRQRKIFLPSRPI